MMGKQFLGKAAVFVAGSMALSVAVAACSSDNPGAGTDGGSGGEETGGGKASGGSAGKGSGGASSGGKSSGGTSSGTGGTTPGTGGTPASGGTKSTGGTTGTGGEKPDASTDSGADGADGCRPMESLTPPTVADAIKVPAGSKLLHEFHAIGTQNYTCTASTDATPVYAWSASVPEAFLYDSCSRKKIQHSAGPTWTWLADGSSIKGTKLASSAVTNAIPELLLSTTSVGNQGELADVKYVQRLATSGGVSPAAGDCTAATVNEVKKVPYEATYYFYEFVPPSDAGRDH